MAVGPLAARAAEVANARASVDVEREEIQAAEASPEALAAGKEILEQLIGLMGYRATVTVALGRDLQDRRQPASTTRRRRRSARYRAQGRAPLRAAAPGQPDALAPHGRVDARPRRRRGLPRPPRAAAHSNVLLLLPWLSSVLLDVRVDDPARRAPAREDVRARRAVGALGIRDNHLVGAALAKERREVVADDGARFQNEPSGPAWNLGIATSSEKQIGDTTHAADRITSLTTRFLTRLSNRECRELGHFSSPGSWVGGRTRALPRRRS